MAHKWTKAQRIKFNKTWKTKYAKRGRAANARIAPERGRPLVQGDVALPQEVAHVDVHRIEQKSFRNGMSTALSMVIDILIRELR